MSETKFINRLPDTTEYSSKTKRGECKNLDCNNYRRDKSAYCQKCSDKHNSK